MTARLLPLQEAVNADGAVRPVGSGVTIGHVHLKVADLERALAFYCGVLGFELMQRYGARRPSSRRASATHIGLNTWESRGGQRRRPARRGCSTPPFSTRAGPSWPTPCAAFSRPGSCWTGRATTASARRSTCAIPTRTASSSTGTARRPSVPRNPDGTLAMFTRRLDVDDLLREAQPAG